MTIKAVTIDWATEIAKMQRAFMGANHSAGRFGRSLTRSIRQQQRNALTGPLSQERKDIQVIGRLEMDAASRWLHRLMMQERITLDLPMCEATIGPIPKLDGQTFACALEPRHRDDHESVDGAIWSTQPTTTPTPEHDDQEDV